MQKKKNSSGALKAVAIGAGLAGLAATAYFFLGPKGKKHQKDTKAWAIKMKRDVVEKLKKAQKITEPIYRGIIDSVAKENAKGMKAGRAEIGALAIDLKKHWKSISKSALAVKTGATKNASKIVKTAKKARR